MCVNDKIRAVGKERMLAKRIVMFSTNPGRWHSGGHVAAADMCGTIRKGKAGEARCRRGL